MSLVILSLATMWMGTGLFHILPKAREIVLGNATDTLLDADAFLPGYGSFLLLFLINFLLLTASKSHRSISVLLFLSTTLMVFELLDIYTAIHGSFVIYVLLSLFCFFSFLSYANFRLSKHNSISPLDSVHHTSSRKNISQHQMHLLLLTGLSVVSFVVFAFRGFPITKPVSLFAWQIAAGIVMVLYGISTLRAKIRWFSADLILSGLFWFAVSAYYIVADFVNLRVTLSSPVAVVMCVTSLIMVFVRVPNNAISAIIFLCKFLVFISLTTDQSSFQSVAGWIGIVLSAYGFTAYLTHFLNFQTKIPVFENIANMPSFRAIKSKALICSRTLERKSSTADAMMGYSKYLNTDDLAFAANAIAALSLSWVESGEEALVLPWVLGFGGTVQFVLGFVAFSRGKTFESSFFIFSALFWSIWGTVRCTSADDISLSASLGCISFLLVSMLFVVLSCTLSKLWMVVTSLFSLVILSNWLILLKVSGIKVFGLITFSCYAISCLYAFVSLTLKHIYDHDVFPLGKPIVQISHLHTDGSKAFWAESRRATGVKAIAGKSYCKFWAESRRANGVKAIAGMSYCKFWAESRRANGVKAIAGMSYCKFWAESRRANGVKAIAGMSYCKFWAESRRATGVKAIAGMSYCKFWAESRRATGVKAIAGMSYCKFWAESRRATGVKAIAGMGEVTTGQRLL